MNPKVSLIHLEAEISEIKNDMRFFYRAKCGVVEIENYGIKLAHNYLPLELITISDEILKRIKTIQGADKSLEVKGMRKTIERRRKIIQVLKIYNYSSLSFFN